VSRFIDHLTADVLLLLLDRLSSKSMAVRRKELPKELGKPNLATVVLEVSSKAVLR